MRGGVRVLPYYCTMQRLSRKKLECDLCGRECVLLVEKRNLARLCPKLKICRSKLRVLLRSNSKAVLEVFTRPFLIGES